MKKIIFAILILVLAGVGLAYLSSKDNKALDQDVFAETTDSIRSLVLLDGELNELLLKSRFGIDRDYDKVIDIAQQLSEEFDNLRFAAAFEEIEKIEPLDRAVFAFDELLVAKLDSVEQFKEKNAQLNELLRSFPTITSDFIDSLPGNEGVDDNNVTVSGAFFSNLSAIALIDTMNNALYRYLLSDTDEDRQAVVDQLPQVKALKNEFQPELNPETYNRYVNTIILLLNVQQTTQEFLKSAINEPSSEKLNDIEVAYINYYDDAVSKSNKLRDYLVAYGVVLLLFLIYLGYMLRKSFQGLEQKVAERTEEIEQAYSELQESQEQLIQSEKLASLGGMVAGVAHEMNTPLAYVGSNVTSVSANMDVLETSVKNLSHLYEILRKPNKDNNVISAHIKQMLTDYIELETPEVFEESKELLEDGQHGLKEISNLVVSLKDFARLDRQITESVPVESCLDTTLTIATNHIKENNVTVERSYQETADIECIPSKLNQLFLNIITNAAQAIGQDGGLLKISTEQVDDQIAIRFADDGEGMDEETQKKMFDPFFTSKPIGQGTGLGMSISYKIVEAHNGSIEVESEKGLGSVITVKLPITQPEEQTSAAA